MIPNIVISFETGDLETGLLSTTRIYSKVAHPITSSLVDDIERVINHFLSSDPYLTLESGFIHIELSSDNRIFFNRKNIFASNTGNIHPYRMQLILNSLKRILL